MLSISYYLHRFILFLETSAGSEIISTVSSFFVSFICRKYHLCSVSVNNFINQVKYLSLLVTINDANIPGLLSGRVNIENLPIHSPFFTEFTEKICWWYINIPFFFAAYISYLVISKVELRYFNGKYAALFGMVLHLLIYLYIVYIVVITGQNPNFAGMLFIYVVKLESHVDVTTLYYMTSLSFVEVVVVMLLLFPRFNVHTVLYYVVNTFLTSSLLSGLLLCNNYEVIPSLLSTFVLLITLVFCLFKKKVQLSFPIIYWSFIIIFLSIFTTTSLYAGYDAYPTFHDFLVTGMNSELAPNTAETNTDPFTEPEKLSLAQAIFWNFVAYLTTLVTFYKATFKHLFHFCNVKL